MTRFTLVLRALAFIVLVAFVTGFALFIREARALTVDSDVRADAIVVLTGGEGRVVTGVDLLKDGRGRRLLISGVNPGSPPQDIARAAGAPAGLFECCIDTGDEAVDTRSNATETAAWAARNGYGSLIIVTNDYHMPRALLELQAAMPDTRLTAYPVRAASPWADAGEARRWMQEYAKYAAVYARERIAF
jgi:uncharacterized SAM-binding protein YcdF (DUF218 family)